MFTKATSVAHSDFGSDSDFGSVSDAVSSSFSISVDAGRSGAFSVIQ